MISHVAITHKFNIKRGYAFLFSSEFGNVLFMSVTNSNDNWRYHIKPYFLSNAIDSVDLLVLNANNIDKYNFMQEIKAKHIISNIHIDDGDICASGQEYSMLDAKVLFMANNESINPYASNTCTLSIQYKHNKILFIGADNVDSINYLIKYHPYQLSGDYLVADKIKRYKRFYFLNKLINGNEILYESKYE